MWLALSKVSVRQDGEGVVDGSVLGSRDIWWRTSTSQLREGGAEVPQRDRALVSDFCHLGRTIKFPDSSQVEPPPENRMKARACSRGTSWLCWFSSAVFFLFQYVCKCFALEEQPRWST